jgi:hypothetical protein
MLKSNDGPVDKPKITHTLCVEMEAAGPTNSDTISFTTYKDVAEDKVFYVIEFLKYLTELKELAKAGKDYETRKAPEKLLAKMGNEESGTWIEDMTLHPGVFTFPRSGLDFDLVKFMERYYFEVTVMASEKQA